MSTLLYKREKKIFRDKVSTHNMNRKRNVAYIKPEDPEFLKVLKKQAGYDDRNHKFDELENSEKDFVDDGDSEQPQVVVLKKGDLTAEEAEEERMKTERQESEKKADLNERIIFKSKNAKDPTLGTKKRKLKSDTQNKNNSTSKKQSQLLSFGDEDDDS